MMLRVSCAGMFLLALVGFSGCGSEPEGPPTYEVSGAVTLDGAPLSKGTIHFVSPEDLANGVPSPSAEIVDGKYQTSSTAGKKKVLIRAPIESGPPDVTGLVPTKETIPARYNERSELEVEVTEAAPNQHDFTLKSS